MEKSKAIYIMQLDKSYLLNRPMGGLQPLDPPPPPTPLHVVSPSWMNPSEIAIGVVNIPCSYYDNYRDSVDNTCKPESSNFSIIICGVASAPVRRGLLIQQ